MPVVLLPSLATTCWCFDLITAGGRQQAVHRGAAQCPLGLQGLGQGAGPLHASGDSGIAKASLRPHIQAALGAVQQRRAQQCTVSRLQRSAKVMPPPREPATLGQAPQLQEQPGGWPQQHVQAHMRQQHLQQRRYCHLQPCSQHQLCAGPHGAPCSTCCCRARS